MEKTLKFVKNTSLLAMGLLAVFVGGGVVAVVFKAITWDQLGDWTLKAVLVSLVVVAVSAVVGMTAEIASSKKNSEDK